MSSGTLLPNSAIEESRQKQKDLVGRSESGYKEIAGKQTL
jgi:hypothetical protein